jgi:hypothetical protein
MRRKKTEDVQNWREWLESRPLVVLVGVAVAVSSATATLATYFFEKEKKITEQSHAAELQQAKSDLAARIKDLEGRLLSIERHVGTETIWDVNRILVPSSQVKALGSDFAYFDDLQCYLAVPKSGAWTFKQTNELEFYAMVSGPGWLKDQLATSTGKLMSSLKIFCWRRPDAFEIETSVPQVPVLHVFPYVVIERVNNRKMREDTGKFIDEEELEAKQKAAAEAKRTLDEKRDEKIPSDTAAISPSASATGSPQAGGESPGPTSLSEVEARKDALNRLFDADFISMMLDINISSGAQISAFVQGASFHVLDIEKRGNVFYMRSQIVFPPSGPRPKVYFDREMICVGDNEDTVMVLTGAPSTDQRPPEGPWIYSFLAGLRVVLR